MRAFVRHSRLRTRLGAARATALACLRTALALLPIAIGARAHAQALPAVRSGDFFSGARSHVEVGGKLFFTAVADPHFAFTAATGLYVFDPAEGRVRALPTPVMGWTGSLWSMFDRVYWTHSAGAGGTDRRWYLDAWTAAGELTDLRWMGANAPSTPVALNGDLYFTAGYGPSAAMAVPAVWRSVGGLEPAEPVLDGFLAGSLTSLNGRLFFGHRSELWTSDGTQAGSRMLQRFDGWVGDLIPLGGDLLFTVDTERATAELWRVASNGTGMRKVYDLGHAARRPRSFATLGSIVYFGWDDGVHGTELWRTDGSSAGTVLVGDIAPGAASADPQQLTVFRGALYFTARGPRGVELYRTEPRASTATLVRDIHPGGDASPHGLKVVGERLYFAADDGQTGSEPWSSDGSEAGTQRVIDLNPGALSSRPTQFADLGGTPYFWASDGTWRDALFRLRGDAVELEAVPRSATGLRIDGEFADWDEEAVDATPFPDETGDVAASDPIDWRSASMHVQADSLFLTYRTAGLIDFTKAPHGYNVFLDTDRNTETGYRSGATEFDIGAEYVVQGGTLFRYVGTGSTWAWESLGFIAYSYAGDRLELSIAESAITSGSLIGARVLLYADNPTTDDYAHPALQPE